MRKTINEVKQCFTEHGCELLEDVYANAHVKMKYRCVCGNESHINFNNFRSGKRCGCGRQGVKRLTEDEIKIEVEARGCKFISSDFLDNKHIVKCICHCGLERCCELKSLRRSKNCSKCRNRDMALEYEKVKAYFAEHGCELLDVEYKNARTKMKYKCVCGDISEIVFDSFQRGNRCQKCGGKKISDKVAGENHPNWNPNREQVKSNLYFRKRCCGLVKNALKCIGRTKISKTAELLGYDYKQLREHIQNHPNWNIVKNGKWHVDHKFPIKAFLDYGISDLKVINGLDNLQPLSKRDNLSKHDSYDSGEFEKWLISKGVKNG